MQQYTTIHAVITKLIEDENPLHYYHNSIRFAIYFYPNLLASLIQNY